MEKPGDAPLVKARRRLPRRVGGNRSTLTHQNRDEEWPHNMRKTTHGRLALRSAFFIALACTAASLGWHWLSDSPPVQLADPSLPGKNRNAVAESQENRYVLRGGLESDGKKAQTVIALPEEILLSPLEQYLRHAPPPPNTAPIQKQEPKEKEDPEYIQKLIDQVRYSSDPNERASGLSRLGFLKPTPEIVQVCLLALADLEKVVRIEAAMALDTLQDPSAIPTLQQALREEPIEEVRQIINETLAELTRLSENRGS